MVEVIVVITAEMPEVVLVFGTTTAA